MPTSSERQAPRFARRLITTGGLCALGLCAWRLVHTQAGATLAGGATSQLGERTRVLEGPRGEVLDRHGRPLATSQLAYDVQLEIHANESMPSLLAEDLIAALELAGPLPRSQRERIRRYVQLPAEGLRTDQWEGKEPGKRRGYRYLWTRPIAKGVCEYPVLVRLSALANDRYYYEEKGPDGKPRKRRPGLFRLNLREEWRRSYPLGAAAGHVLGLEPREVAIPGSDETAKVRYGLETLPILDLRGRVEIQERVAASGDRFVRGTGSAPLARELPRAVVRTTIDADVQEEAHRRLVRAAEFADAARALLFVVDLESGDLLALAGWPSFDPQDPKPHPATGKVPLFPVTHQSLFVPGSVIKPLLVAQALHEGLVHTDSRIDCRGNMGPKRFNIGGPGARPGSRSYRIIRDDHAVPVVSLARVLIESSNIGAVRIGMLGGREFHQRLLERFRLAAQPMLGLPLVRDSRGEPRPGSVPAAKYFTDRHYYERDAGPSISFGYQLNVFPLAFGEAFATAITGRRFQFRLLRAFGEPGAKPRPYPAAGPGERLFDAERSLWLRRTLARVITDPKGTGRHVHDESVANWLGGKTGTSFLRYGNGKKRYFASFAGFAPIEDPKWLAFCIVEKSDGKKVYGGTYAAPAVKDILLYLRDREGRSRRISSAR